MEDATDRAEAEPDPGKVELDKVLEGIDADWRDESGAGAPEDGGGAAAGEGPSEPVLEPQTPTLEGKHLEGVVDTGWRWLWKRAARARGIDPEDDDELREHLEDSATDDMAEALAAILDRWLPEIIRRYPNLNRLAAAVVLSSIPLVSYLSEHELEDEDAEDDEPTDQETADGQPDPDEEGEDWIGDEGPEPQPDDELEAEGGYGR